MCYYSPTDELKQGRVFLLLGEFTYGKTQLPCLIIAKLCRVKSRINVGVICLEFKGEDVLPK